MDIYLSIDLLSVAVLIHHAEVTQGRQVVLAAGLDKLLSTGQSCEHAHGRTLYCKEPPKALGGLCGPPGRLLGVFWVLSEASWSPVQMSRRLLGNLLGMLESSWRCPGAFLNH